MSDPNRHFPWRTRRYIPTSESIGLCSRQWTSPFSYLECAVRLFSGAAKRSALQVWSQKSVFLILVCSAATRDFLLTFGVLYANKIPKNRLWTTDGSLDIDLRWSYSRPRSGTIQLCVLLSWSVCHAHQDTCSGLMISQDLSRVTASYLYPQTPWICLLSTPSLGELVLSKSLLLSQQSGLPLYYPYPTRYLIHYLTLGTLVSQSGTCSFTASSMSSQGHYTCQNHSYGPSPRQDPSHVHFLWSI